MAPQPDEIAAAIKNLRMLGAYHATGPRRADTVPMQTKSKPVEKLAKLVLGALHETGMDVEAQYNPKEIKVSQPVSWHAAKPESLDDEDALAMEFGGSQPQTYTIELLFDGFETGGTVGDGTQTVLDKLMTLKALASVKDAYSDNPADRRPRFCIVSWGTGGMPPLRCVIESLATTYTMFSSTGNVLRATVALSLKEADSVASHRKRARTGATAGTEYAS